MNWCFSSSIKRWYICEPIATRYFREITGMTKRYDDNDKVFLPHHTSKNQYSAQLWFERGSIVTFLKVITSYITSDEYEPRPFGVAWTEVSTRLYCLRYTDFWQWCSDKFTKLIIKSKALVFCDACYIFINYYNSVKK